MMEGDNTANVEDSSSVPILTEKSVKYGFYIKIGTCKDFCRNLLKNTEFLLFIRNL